MILPYIEQSSLFNTLNVGPDSASDAFSKNPEMMSKRFQIFRCPSDTGPDNVYTTSGMNLGMVVLNSSGTPTKTGITNYLGVNNIRYVRQKKAPNLIGNTGAYGVFFKDSNTRFRDITDGSSNTILIGERAWESGDPAAPMRAGTLFAIRDFQKKGPMSYDVSTLNANQGMQFAVGTIYDGINPVTIYTPTDHCHACESFSSRHSGGAHFVLADGSVRFISEFVQQDPSIPIDSTMEYLAAISDGNPVGEF